MQKRSFLVSIMVLLAVLLKANPAVEQIANAFSTANAAMVVSYFDSNIDLKILDVENIYSRQQARVLLMNFIKDKEPSLFKLKHEGGPENARFAIGELTAKDGIYRVYYLLKEKNSTHYIYKLRIERNE